MPDFILTSPQFYIAFIRETYRDDLYARLTHLFNAGCRGADLR